MGRGKVEGRGDWKFIPENHVQDRLRYSSKEIYALRNGRIAVSWKKGVYVCWNKGE